MDAPPDPFAGGNPEAELCCVHIKRVVLPNDQVKHDVVFSADNLVQQEKARLLAEAGIPNPSEYVMVLCPVDGTHIQLEDSKSVDEVGNLLAQGAEWEIRIQRRE